MEKQREIYKKIFKKHGRYDGYPAIDNFHYHYLDIIKFIPQEPVGLPLYYNLLLLSHTIYYTGIEYLGTSIGYTSEEIKQITVKHDESLNSISDKYQFKNFIQLAKYFGLTFSEWMSLSVFAKRALIYEVEEFVSQEKKQVNESKRQQELEMKNMNFRNRSRGPSAAQSISIFK